ncbi:MAG: isoprenylcysteine carboxylmethyltransferase family protein [Proteobacteria bacterium]|nr:isoprenylcysteine carboxylmethyltransferase family protein [Pseudomonadota bacterium]
MAKLAAVLYGLLCYAVFLAVLLYTVGFVADVGVPLTIDGPTRDDGPAVAWMVDLGLVLVFGLQHSVMARPGFKALWTRVVPPAVERSTYLLFSSAALVLLFVFWRPIPQPVWAVEGLAAAGLWTLGALGWLIALISTFLINHFDLFGLRQVWAYGSGRSAPSTEFREPLFYRVVRHPLYVGFILAFWAAPVMSRGHLLFAAAMTAYILIAIRFEERDLVAALGERYRAYQKRVSMIVPWFPARPAADKPDAAE